MNLSLLLGEWGDFAIRWLHVVAGVCWIGSSFYFVALDLGLRKDRPMPAGAGGEAWQVHGGGFYHLTKYMVAPQQMPEELTWFKWEAYTTFLSGLALLCWHYFANADLYLIDRTVWAMEPWQAVAIGLGVLVAGWIVYDLLCRSPLARNDVALAGAVFVALSAAGYGLTRVFGGRGAFIELGAIIGTIMVANVAMVIIPNQRKVVKALIAGETPDPAYGRTGKSRSLHNNYLTLPVIFLMVSNHYPLAFGSRWNWVIAALVIVMGGLIRHFFNTHHAGGRNPWWAWAVAAALFVAAALLSGIPPATETAASLTAPAAIAQAAPQTPTFAQVQDVVISRCSMCHAKEPVWDGVGVAPKGVMLDTPEAILAHAHQIGLQAVWTHAMPPGGNITEITPDERRVLALWIDAGAPAD